VDLFIFLAFLLSALFFSQFSSNISPSPFSLDYFIIIEEWGIEKATLAQNPSLFIGITFH
jgi:hypothetical protein